MPPLHLVGHDTPPAKKSGTTTDDPVARGVRTVRIELTALSSRTSHVLQLQRQPELLCVRRSDDLPGIEPTGRCLELHPWLARAAQDEGTAKGGDSWRPEQRQCQCQPCNDRPFPPCRCVFLLCQQCSDVNSSSLFLLDEIPADQPSPAVPRYFVSFPSFRGRRRRGGASRHRDSSPVTGPDHHRRLVSSISTGSTVRAGRGVRRHRRYCPSVGQCLCVGGQHERCQRTHGTAHFPRLGSAGGTFRQRWEFVVKVLMWLALSLSRWRKKQQGTLGRDRRGRLFVIPSTHTPHRRLLLAEYSPIPLHEKSLHK